MSQDGFTKIEDLLLEYADQLSVVAPSSTSESLSNIADSIVSSDEALSLSAIFGVDVKVDGNLLICKSLNRIDTYMLPCDIELLPDIEQNIRGNLFFYDMNNRYYKNKLHYLKGKIESILKLLEEITNRFAIMYSGSQYDMYVLAYGLASLVKSYAHDYTINNDFKIVGFIPYEHITQIFSSTEIFENSNIMFQVVGDSSTITQISNGYYTYYGILVDNNLVFNGTGYLTTYKVRFPLDAQVAKISHLRLRGLLAEKLRDVNEICNSLNDKFSNLLGMLV